MSIATVPGYLRMRLIASATADFRRACFGGQLDLWEHVKNVLTAMQGVATELDCAVGTLYTAFGSKAELLAALQAERDALVQQKTEAEQRAAAEHESRSNWQMRFGLAIAGAVVLFIIGMAAGSGARGSGSGKGGQ